MAQNPQLEALISDAKARFEQCVRDFEPRTNDNTFCERNLSFQLLSAFRDRSPNGRVFLEVPVPRKDRTGRGFLDAYAFDDEVALLIECKRVWRTDDVRSVLSDIATLDDSRTLEYLNGRHCAEAQGRQAWGVVLAEAPPKGERAAKIAEWWSGRGKEPFPCGRRKEAGLFGEISAAWHFNALELQVSAGLEGRHQGRSFWLYAYAPVPCSQKEGA